MKQLAFLFFLAAPVEAETILSPSDFETYAQGSTVYFSRHGQPYGAEQYLRNRKVIWSFADGTCEFGEWFPKGDQLCFQYEHQATPLCWNYIETEAGKGVRVVGDDPENDLLIAGQDKQHLECAAPNVGASYRPYSSNNDPWLADFADDLGLEAPASFSLPSLN
jgi:hypothetical protein